jgi:glycosyltransferase involved in cell wall biosynthesis
MGRAAVFALASERESFGIVSAEAMASGLPVVASATPGSSDIVVDGLTGSLFPIGDVGRLAAALERLIDEPGLRESMGLAGRRRVEDCYSWDHRIGRIEGLLHSI